MPGREVAGAIDVSSIPFLRRANERLLDDSNWRQFGRQFADNVALVETVFWEIIRHAGLDVDVPFKPARRTAAECEGLEDALRTTIAKSSSTDLAAKASH